MYYTILARLITPIKSILSSYVSLRKRRVTAWEENDRQYTANAKRNFEISISSKADLGLLCKPTLTEPT